MRKLHFSVQNRAAKYWATHAIPSFDVMLVGSRREFQILGEECRSVASNCQDLTR